MMTTHLKTTLSIIAVLFASFSLTLNSQAQGFFDTTSDNAFLPVEEAYQVVPALEVKDGVTRATFNWTAVEGYFLYRHQFKLTVKNAQEGFELPLELEPGKRKFDEYFQKELEIYYKATSIRATIPPIAAPYEITLQSQGCADAGLCYPPYKHYFRVEASGVALPLDQPSFNEVAVKNLVVTAPPVENGASTPAQKQSSVLYILYIMFLAILGGLILNLMPCVFPVLSLKALSFVNHTGDIKHQKMHGWAYTAGAVASFAVIAIFILVARQTGDELGWGFQLQNPIFVSLLVYLFFVMGLVLSGFVTFAGSWMGMGQKLTAGAGLRSSFFTGVLAAVVASPCSGPFMATAMGIAITQPALVGFIIFCCLGLGMALPFLILSYNPSLGKFLPAPGAWMDTVKQFFAFPLYATGIWLLWVLGHQVGSDAVIAILLGCLFICAAFWLTRSRPIHAVARILKTTCIFILVLVALVFSARVANFANAPSEQWVKYTPEDLATLRAEKRAVFVDLTADWCLTCKINEKIALNTERVQERAKELNIAMMQGDWTNADPTITALLSQYGRNGVPLYLMYPADNTKGAKVLPQLLTQQMVLNAMDEAMQ